MDKFIETAVKLEELRKSAEEIFGDEWKDACKDADECLSVLIKHNGAKSRIQAWAKEFHGKIKPSTSDMMLLACAVQLDQDERIAMKKGGEK